MAPTNSVFSNCIYFIIFVIVLKCNDVQSASNQTKFNVLDFEQIKNDLFTRGDFSTLNDNRCLMELGTVAKGLQKSQEWAMKRKLIFFFHFFESMLSHY